MAQYIDKAAVVAEIEKLSAYLDGFHEQRIIEKILSIIDTLEVKEVDLQKEYDKEFFNDPIYGKLVNRNAGIGIAKHFFELGLKVAQKG